MAKITLGGNPAETLGELPAVGTKAPDFKLTATDMSTKTLNDFSGHTLLLNIFPSVNTGVCSASVRRFNTEAAKADNVKVLCISKDLPFAQQQFCAAEGIENVVMLSDFKTGQFGKDYKVTAVGSAFDGLLSRAVVIVDPDGMVTYTEQVPEIGQEPDYEAALSAL
jgi:thiol peroxidase